MSATDRFKWLLANALERVCTLEHALEVAEQEVATLREAAEPESER